MAQYRVWRNNGSNSWAECLQVKRSNGSGGWTTIQKGWRYNGTTKQWDFVYWAPIHVYISSSDNDFNDNKLRSAVLAACGGSFPTGRTIIIHIMDNVFLTRSSASVRNQDYTVAIWNFTVGTGNRIILDIRPGAVIVGYGGNGGYNTAPHGFVQATAGWDALYISNDIIEGIVFNRGIIAGGGGGGAMYSRQEGGSGNYYSPGGGGAPYGKAGNPYQADWWATANPGTQTTGGTANPSQNGGRGGTGGNWGQAGENSEAERTTSFGGASGWSISIKAGTSVTWMPSGDIRGPQRSV